MLRHYWLVKVAFWKYAPSDERKHRSTDSSHDFCCRDIKEFGPVGNVSVFKRSWGNVQHFSFCNVHDFLLLFHKFVERGIRLRVFNLILSSLTRKIILDISSSNLVDIVYWDSSRLRERFDDLLVFIRSIIVHFCFLLISHESHFLVFWVGLL